MTIRKILKEEFIKLKELFPGNEELWIKYKEQRLQQFENKEIDVYVIEEDEKFIGELTVNYISRNLLSETTPNIRVYFEAFRIDKRYQEKGLGQMLIRYTINDLTQIGYFEFTIGVEDSNEIAKHIYFKYGFIEPIDYGKGDEFDPSEYTLYLKKIDRIIPILYKLINKLELGNIKQEIYRVSGGLLNRMYKVITSSGIYAVKHLNPEVMKRSNAIKNHIFAEKIANIAKTNGIQCIAANVYNGYSLQEIDNNYFLIFDWFEGKSITDKEITLDKVKKVAKQLANLHQINFNIPNSSDLGESSIEVNWNYYFEKIDDAEIKELLAKNIDYLIELDKKSTIASLKILNNKVISHRDLDLPNILWDNNENPVLIDWESAGLVNPCEELLETAWDWSGGQDYFDKEKFDCFIETYKLSGGNIDDLKDAILANFKNKAGWLEYNIKRVCKIECLDEEEQKLGKKEVIRVINEIIKFYDIMKNIRVEDYN